MVNIWYWPGMIDLRIVKIKRNLSFIPSLAFTFVSAKYVPIRTPQGTFGIAGPDNAMERGSRERKQGALVCEVLIGSNHLHNLLLADRVQGRSQAEGLGGAEPT